MRGLRSADGQLVGRPSRTPRCVLPEPNPAARIRSWAPDAFRAATSRSRTAARYSSWVQPASRAWSASRAGGFGDPGRLQRARQVGQLLERLGASLALGLRWPSGHLPVGQGASGRAVDEAEGTVVVGQVPHQPFVRIRLLVGVAGTARAAPSPQRRGQGR